MDPREVVATYRAAWNEPDHTKRIALLEASFAGDGVYQDPTVTAEGCAALAAHIGGFHGQYPDHSVDQASDVDVTPGGLRWAWEIRNDEGVVIEGSEFAELAPDGRLQRIAAFFGPLPPLA